MAESKILDLGFLTSMYKTMLKIRISEERIADLVEEGRIKTPCHLYIGQEAIATGVCATLNKEDYVWGGHRSHGHYLAKGGNLNAMMAEIFGKVTGCSQGRGGSMHLLASEVGIMGTVPLVAATIPLAVGAGLAIKLKKENNISVSFFGDGATEEGHFHESMNLAAVYKLPVLFVCENNFYASHLSLLERRSRDNIIESAQAHGISGFQVDGNDIFEIYNAAKGASEKARTGGGPTFIECRTYRWRGHVGPSWNLDVGVKRKDEIKEWLPKDPVSRLRKVLFQKQVSEKKLNEIEKEINTQVEASVSFAIESPFPDQSDLRDHVFVSPKEGQ